MKVWTVLGILVFALIIGGAIGLLSGWGWGLFTGVMVAGVYLRLARQGKLKKPRKYVA